MRGDRARGLGRHGPAGARPGARRARARLCARGAGAGRVRAAARDAPRAPQHPRPGRRRRDAGRGRRHHGGGRALVRRARGPAARALLGRDGRRGTRPAARRPVGVALPRARDRPHGAGRESRGRRVARRAGRPRMTDIAYHPARLKAVRDQFRALRAAEFPWTADTVYLNNASTGPIPERTRRALDEFTAQRTAPHLLPDRELQAGLQAPCAAQGWPDEDYLVERLHDPRVRVLAVSFVQFANGHRADLDRLGAACRANGTFLVVDGIQGVGNSVLDVRETPVDILACGGQKWLLSPWGSGFVYVRRELISALEPAVTGWMAFEGTDDFSRLTEYNPTFRADARRFELVTLPFQDFVGMTTSVAMLAELGVDDVEQYTRALHEPVFRWADENGVQVVSPRDDAHRSAIVCLAPERSEEHTSELQSPCNLVCRLLLEKKKKKQRITTL